MGPRPLVLLLLVSSLAACAQPDENGTSTSPSPTPTTNACTPYPKPNATGTGTAPDADNIWARLLEIVCDHSGPAPRELARVPGTPDHVKSATYLEATLDAAGWNARKLPFTGQEYESILLDRSPEPSYKSYYDSCSGDGLQRMRSLNFANVEGRSGTDGGPILLFMAHFDSKRFANADSDAAKRGRPVLGANDGASGVAVLLEWARVMAAGARPWEMRILFTDGEDGFDDCHPLAGSTVYAERLTQAERTRMRGIVLLDMVGDMQATFYKGCGSDETLRNRIWEIARRLGVPQFKNETGCGSFDDHTPFEERQMKTVDILDYRPTAGGFPPYWHTTHDTPDKLDKRLMGDVARILKALVDELPVP